MYSFCNFLYTFFKYVKILRFSLHVYSLSPSIAKYSVTSLRNGQSSLRSEETRKKISEKLKKRVYSIETRKKIGESLKGKICSIETHKMKYGKN